MVTGVVSAAVGASEPAHAGERIAITASSLLAAIPRIGSGAPATNATVPPEMAERIEEMASLLEMAGGGDTRNNAISPRLTGSWRLLYSNAPEITSLASGLPLGFELGPTYQPLDVESGRFENRGSISNRLGLARLATGVVGDVSVSPPNSLNAVGISNDRNNRVAVSFRAIVFSLDEVFGRAVSVRKVLIPKLDPDAGATPANDVTYLDDTVKVVRGGDGSLFVFLRAQPDEDSPMLTDSERERLFLEGEGKGRSKSPRSGGDGRDNAAADVIVGGRKESLKGQPELEFLLQADR